jgi:hypothetical protein
MGIRKRPANKPKKPKAKKKRGMDAEDRALKIETKAAKKQRKLERSMQIQEARKRREAIKAAGTVKMEDVIRAIGTRSSGEVRTAVNDLPDVSALLSSIGLKNQADDFAWSTASEGSFSSSDESLDDSSEDEGQEEEVESELGSEDGEDMEYEKGSVESEEEETKRELFHKRITFSSCTDFSSLETQQLLTSLMSGKDVVFTSEKFHEESVRSSYLMLSAYMLSFMLHKAERVEKNNRRLRKKPHLLMQEEDSCMSSFRDQGPNRPRICFIAPFRGNANELVRNWMSLLNLEASEVGNFEKFDEEYKDQDVRNEHSKNWEPWRRELFKGHYDDANYDDFCIGINFTFGGKMRILFPKTSQAICSSVDVIVASPLALSRIAAADRRAIRLRDKHKVEEEGENGDNNIEEDGKPIMDFLSGIELLVVDRIDALAMQNLDNCVDIVNSVNARAVSTISADINRIEAKFHSPETARAARQTVLFAGSTLRDEYFTSLGLRDVFDYDDHRNCSGVALTRALKQKIKQQFFIRVPIHHVSERTDTLIQYFKNNFWKEVGNEIKQLVIVVANAQDFLPLQEFLHDEGIVDCFLSELTLSDIGGKRRKQMKHILRAFREGDIRTIVVTERLLWYQRIRITGAKHVLFLGCPLTDSIYHDVLADITDPFRCTSTCLFTANEKLAIERVVGTHNLDKLVTDQPIETMAGKTTVFTPS